MPRYSTNRHSWIDEQYATPSTPQPVVAETNTPEWSGDEDVTSISQNPILETATPFHLPDVPFFQEFVDRGADLVDLWDPNFEGSNFDKDESVLRSSSASRQTFTYPHTCATFILLWWGN